MTVVSSQGDPQTSWLLWSMPQWQCITIAG